MNFVGIPSIEGFHNVVKAAAKYDVVETYDYDGKPKMHGTFGGVRVVDGEIMAESKNYLITPQKDNAGFAKWVDSHKLYFSNLPLKDHTIFGEWCGPGIMSGAAISQIKNKIFAVFAIVDSETKTMIVEPKEIEKILAGSDKCGDFSKRPSDVYVLPWCDSVKVDFSRRSSLHDIADSLNAYIDRIEKCDPWVKETFGVEGVAEGVVYYPRLPVLSVETFEYFSFKAKGSLHQVNRQKQPVLVDPNVSATIDEFVNAFVTEARMAQAVAAIAMPIDTKNMGPFLKWVVEDIQKESVDELEASDLTWEKVQKGVQKEARNWFLKKSREI